MKIHLTLHQKKKFHLHLSSSLHLLPKVLQTSQDAVRQDHALGIKAWPSRILETVEEDGILTAWLFFYISAVCKQFLYDRIFTSFMLTSIIQWLKFSILWEELRHGNPDTSTEVIRRAGLTDQHTACRSGLLGVFRGSRGSQLCELRLYKTHTS